MNAQNRILNSAIQRFVKTPVNAPSYYDLTADDNLQQCNEREVISIFGILFFVYYVIYRRNTYSLSMGRLLWNIRINEFYKK